LEKNIFVLAADFVCKPPTMSAQQNSAAAAAEKSHELEPCPLHYEFWVPRNRFEALKKFLVQNNRVLALLQALLWDIVVIFAKKNCQDLTYTLPIEN
jgi:hypothetical protein